MTPHISAKKNEIAKTVLMAGDPLRAKWIAETFLQQPKLVSQVRNMFVYTGTYKTKTVTVMGSGMGIPSIGIYSYELFNFYDVDLIIRIGSAGAYCSSVNLGDVVLASEAYSESTYAKMLGFKVNDCVIKANAKYVKLVAKVAKENNIALKIGRVHSADCFYNNKTLSYLNKKTKALVVEMEAFGLFANAKKLKKEAVCLLTCSDSLVTGESMSANERQFGFSNMVKLAFEFVIAKSEAEQNGK